MTWILFITIWIAGLSYSESADAGPDAGSWLTASLVSKHINAKREFNEVNPGLGFRFDIDNKTVVMGIYKNSFSNPSGYIGRYYETSTRLLGYRVGGSLTYGLVNGYRTTYSPGQLLPFVLTGLFARARDFETQLGVFPIPSSPVLTLSIGWRF